MDEIHPPICSLPLHHGFFAREAPDRAHILQGLAAEKKKVAGGSPPKYANNRLLIPKDFMVKSLSFLDFSGSITNFVSSTPDTTPKSGRPNKRRNLRRDAVQCC